MDMKDFLKKAVSGTGHFDPRSSSHADMLEFQSVVELASRAKSLGYIEDFKIHQESHSGHDFYDALLVFGVTDEGLHYAGGP
jgi:hypothetical protein